jgi:hypothetical protein
MEKEVHGGAGGTTASPMGGLGWAAATAKSRG